MKKFVSSGTLVFVLIQVTGCNVLPWRASPPPDPSIKLLVSQVKMAAPLSSPDDLKSFDKEPAAEDEAAVMAQLIEEVEERAQRIFIEQLVQQTGFTVVSSAEVAEIRTNLNLTQNDLDVTQLGILGTEAGADIVLSGRILDYGKVQWQYWMAGLVISMLAETLIVGAATGFNPVIMVATAASELLTDLPFWWGGAYIAGWGFRPVRIQVKALQITGCKQRVWKEQELIVLIPGKSLKKYTPEERKRKEIQLGVNVEESLMELAKTAGQEMRLKPCK